MHTDIQCEVKNLFKSHLKTQKNSLSIIPAMVFLFVNILINNLLMRFFNIENCKIRLNKNSLHRFVVGFSPA